jgi:hypothetical protein
MEAVAAIVAALAKQKAAAPVVDPSSKWKWR